MSETMSRFGAEPEGDWARERAREVDAAVAPFVAQLAERDAEVERLRAQVAGQAAATAALERECGLLRAVATAAAEFLPAVVQKEPERFAISGRLADAIAAARAALAKGAT